MRLPLKLLLLLLLLCAGWSARADIVVVMRAQSSVEHLTRDEVTNIFMGRFRTLPAGGAALPIDQPVGSAIRNHFYQRLINKDAAEINAYWSRLYFSGKTSPPVQADSHVEVVELILSRPGALGYIERQKLDSRLRVVYELPP